MSAAPAMAASRRSGLGPVADSSSRSSSSQITAVPWPSDVRTSTISGSIEAGSGRSSHHDLRRSHSFTSHLAAASRPPERETDGQPAALRERGGFEAQSKPAQIRARARVSGIAAPEAHRFYQLGLGHPAAVVQDRNDGLRNRPNIDRDRMCVGGYAVVDQIGQGRCGGIPERAERVHQGWRCRRQLLTAWLNQATGCVRPNRAEISHGP